MSLIYHAKTYMYRNIHQKNNTDEKKNKWKNLKKNNSPKLLGLGYITYSR